MEQEVVMEEAAPSAAAPAALEAAAARPARPKRSISDLRSQIDTAMEAQAARQARATREIQRLERISSDSHPGELSLTPHNNEIFKHCAMNIPGAHQHLCTGSLQVCLPLQIVSHDLDQFGAVQMAQWPGHKLRLAASVPEIHCLTQIPDMRQYLP